MSDPFIGQIMQVGFNFAPRGWSTCAGQLLSIAQNSALFSLLGTAFGGNGTTTFGLPDLQGRVSIGTGNGAGLSPYVIGQAAGTENTTLNQSQLPAHSHTASLSGAAVPATLKAPVNGAVFGIGTDNAGGVAPQVYCPSGTATSTAFGAVNVAATGNNAAVSLLQPYLAVTTIIALEGIFPSRN